MSEFERIEKLQASLIKAELRAAATAEGIADGMLADVLNYDRTFSVSDDGKVRTNDGQSPSAWLKGMRSTRPHWFGQAKTGGDNFANNPWAASSWNKTSQGKVYAEDPVKAEAMAKAAGCRTVFDAHPPKAS